MSNPNVKRYRVYDEQGNRADDVEHKDGDWVKYSSYQSLELENKRLKVALEKTAKEKVYTTEHICDYRVRFEAVVSRAKQALGG